MASSRFLLPAGAAILMGLISKGVASDATRRDGALVEETSAQVASTAEPPPMVASFADDEATSTDDDLDDDSTVP
jgi:hypothetical protein